MKLLLKTVLILCCIVANSQSKSDSLLLTKTEWINKNLDYIRFDTDTITYNIANKRNDLYFDLGKKAITFEERFFNGGAGIKEEGIRFKIKSLDKNKLIIAPLDSKIDLDQEGMRKLEYEHFFSKKEFVFYNRNKLMSFVDFKKITFISSTCFGTCPSFSLEINRDGTVFYQGRIYAKKHTGNFKGKISDKEMYKLHKLMNRSQLMAINEKWNQSTKPVDKPRFNYIVELKNGELIEVSTNDQHPILDKISNYFISIPEIVELEKTNKRHQFEKPEINAYKIVGIEE
jgi:hypothetical protein